ncbi:MAG: Spy/CpxP family protein refolding chaperone [Deltaproteobacteria bacterium]|nr:Spy/CpxP family protein refolding chaperone [Deltaproteobacteria bacterium]
MKSSKTIQAILTFLLAATFAMGASAQNRKNVDKDKRKDFGNPAFMLQKMTKELTLTDKQQAEIKKIFEAEKAKSKTDIDKLKSLREKMHKEWAQENPDKAKIIALHKEIHAIMGKMGERKIETRIAINNLLTKEQKKKVVELMNNRGRRNGPGMFGEKPGCPCNDGNGPGYRRGNGQRRGQGNGQGRGQGRGVQ